MAEAIPKIDLEPDRALIEGQIPALVATLHQNERPLNGLAGLLDWRFQGAISNAIRAGAIEGKAGECVYFPVVRNGALFHLILIGAGSSESHGRRSRLPESSWKILQRNLASLRLSRVGVSKADFGNLSAEDLSGHLKGVPLCIVR